VAILLPAGVDWVLAFFGIQLGAVAVPVNTRFAPPEIEYVLAGSARMPSCARRPLRRPRSPWTT
jgi:acyl-CoA synthetase (AMP-forming)/AMP-acid ligase II